MQVRKIQDFAELAARSDDWDRLSGGVPFCGSQWLGAWWRHYQPALAAAQRRVELYALAVLDGPSWVGLAPCYVERSRAAGAVVRFLGSNEACSDYLTVLAQAGREAEVAEALADWLAHAGGTPAAHGDRWDTLEWTGGDAEDPMLRLLVERLRARHAGVHARVRHNTWRIELPATWDEYLDGLSKSHRKQLRQFERRMFDTGRARLHTVERIEQLASGWQTLVALHQRRLESLGKPGSFHTPTYTAFHREASEELFRAGRLQLHWLELDGRAAAAEFHLAGDHAVFAYQGGIEPALLDHEPGRLITLATLRRAIAGGYRAFDFCRGDEPYKAHWRAVPRPSVEWRVFSSHSAGRLRQTVWVARENARRWVKRGIGAATGKPA